MFKKIIFIVFLLYYFVKNLPEIIYLFCLREWLYFKMILKELFD